MVMVENVYSEHLMHCGERTSIDGAVASTVVCVSPMRREELPREHAGAAARLADPPGLDGTSMCGSHVLASRTGKIQFAAGKLFDLYGTMAVHDLSRGVDPLVRPARENEDSSTANSFEVGFRLRSACPYSPEIPIETPLEVDVGDAHAPTARHVQGLTENADVVPGETTGLEITDDLIGQARIFKQTHCSFRQIAPPTKVCVQPKLLRLLIRIFSLHTGKHVAHPTGVMILPSINLCSPYGCSVAPIVAANKLAGRSSCRAYSHIRE